MGLFSASTRFTQEMEEKGPGWGKGDCIGVRVVAFELLYKPSEPSLSRPLVISEPSVHSRCNRRSIY